MRIVVQGLGTLFFLACGLERVATLPHSSARGDGSADRAARRAHRDDDRPVAASEDAHLGAEVDARGGPR